jgi:hypothetical protein
MSFVFGFLAGIFTCAFLAAYKIGEAVDAVESFRNHTPDGVSYGYIVRPVAIDGLLADSLRYPIH